MRSVARRDRDRSTAIRDVVFHSGGTSITRSVKERHGVDMLIAPRRHILDSLLVDAAVSAGAQLMTGVTIDGIRRSHTGRVSGVEGRTTTGEVMFPARFVIGADGRGSRIARSVGAEFIEVRGEDSATHYAYFSGEWSALEYHLGDRSLAGVIPTNNGESCIWVCTPADVALHARRSHETIDAAFDALLEASSPELAVRLITGATRRSTTRGIIGMPNHIRNPIGPGWALVGDAGYHRDAITGQGISNAFRDAELLATALDLVLCGDADERPALASYRFERDEQLREIFEITCELTTYPSPDRFMELQKQLGLAVDTQAAILAACPTPQLAAG